KNRGRRDDARPPPGACRRRGARRARRRPRGGGRVAAFAVDAMKRPKPTTKGVEADAFDFACRFLTDFRDSDSPWGSASLLDPAAGDDFWRDHLRRIVRWPSVTIRLQVLAVARGGDAIAIEVVNEFINQMRSLGVMLPIEFEAFSMDVHAGLI